MCDYLGTSWTVNHPLPKRLDLFLTLNRMLHDQELNITLLSLVEFLGHSNSFIVGVAYNEVSDIRAHFPDRVNN